MEVEAQEEQSDAEAARRRFPWRRVVLVAAPLVSVGVVLMATAIGLVFFPRHDNPPTRADAVVVLSGDVGDRLPIGLRLVRRGVAPALVLSYGTEATWVAAKPLCAQPQPFEVLCPTPKQNNTRGEARMIGDLARDRRWRRVIVVTSNYHVTRAGLLIPRCTDARVSMVGSRPASTPRAEWIHHLTHESGGMARALLDRGC